MAEPTPANKNAHRRRRLLLSLLAVAVIAALAVMTTPNPAAPEYRRYVGSPLPDGSRVTFLYPASAEKFSSNRIGFMSELAGVGYVQLTRPSSISERLLYQLHRWRGFYPGNDCEVSIVVFSLGNPLPHPKSLQSRRLEQHFGSVASQGDDRYYCNHVDVIDAKSRLQYLFQYSHSGAFPNTALAIEETKITKSFEVLPSGAAVPTP